MEQPSPELAGLWGDAEVLASLMHADPSLPKDWEPECLDFDESQVSIDRPWEEELCALDHQPLSTTRQMPLSGCRQSADDSCADELTDHADELDDSLRHLEQECKRLREQNSMLRIDFMTLQEQMTLAVEENRTLVRLIGALVPHKASFSLAPQTSAGTSAGRAGPCDGGASAQETATAVLPDASAEGGISDLDQLSQASAFNQGTASAQAPVSPHLAKAQAVAAAALAVNQGNPAAALIDLLSLVVRRQQHLGPEAPLARSLSASH